MTIDIPGFGKIDIKHVVFDYNGTIARDGELIKVWPGQCWPVLEHPGILFCKCALYSTTGSFLDTGRQIQEAFSCLTKDN